MSELWSNPSNTRGERVTYLSVSVNGDGTIVCVQRREYCRVYLSPTSASIVRVQKAQREMRGRT